MAFLCITTAIKKIEIQKQKKVASRVQRRTVSGAHSASLRATYVWGFLNLRFGAPGRFAAPSADRRLQHSRPRARPHRAMPPPLHLQQTHQRFRPELYVNMLHH